MKGILVVLGFFALVYGLAILIWDLVKFFGGRKT